MEVFRATNPTRPPSGDPIPVAVGFLRCSETTKALDGLTAATVQGAIGLEERRGVTPAFPAVRWSPVVCSPGVRHLSESKATEHLFIELMGTRHRYHAMALSEQDHIPGTVSTRVHR